MTLLDRLQRTLAKRVEYRRTAHALSSLPLETQIDLDLNARDTNAIAHRAVYGR